MPGVRQLSSFSRWRETAKIYADLGIDELIFNPATDHLDDVHRLAEVVL